MREIKFRAWDFVNKIMLYHESDYMTKGQWFRMCEKRGITEFDQFTGLHDKNGKEIYEGDILENSQGIKCQVFWKDYGWHLLRLDTIYEFLGFGFERIEIISNIYENPELLK